MAKIYRTTFVVVGTFHFPIDMLRYDRCTPDSETDSLAIGRTYQDAGTDEPVRITVRHESTDRNWQPTVGRWESFRWAVDTRSIERTQP
jgi:hypothetical protein